MSEMADQTLRGVHHLGLTVTDVERGARWNQNVLGFARVGEFGGPHDPRRKLFLNHPGFRFRLGLVEHRDGPADGFDETRTGVDHPSRVIRSVVDLGSLVQSPD